MEVAAAIAVSGSLLMVAVPAFVRNLRFSKLSEPIDGLDRMVTAAITYSEGRPLELSFPPSAPLTPEKVPRGVEQRDTEGAWAHLTWRSLDFRFDGPHRFAFRFESAHDRELGASRFVATAHGDLDGDEVLSTFEVRGERSATREARVLPGMFVDREVE